MKLDNQIGSDTQSNISPIPFYQQYLDQFPKALELGASEYINPKVSRDVFQNLVLVNLLN